MSEYAFSSWSPQSRSSSSVFWSSSYWSYEDRSKVLVICKNPVVMVGHAFPCGQCMPCRIRRGKIWRTRIMLEAKLRSDNAFVTLTYSDENLPAIWVPSGGMKDGMELVGTLVSRHVQLFLKRLRKAFSPETFRFFAVGEYGGRSWRPHYHAVLFGYPGCKRVGGTFRDLYSGVPLPSRCCEWCSKVQKAWPLGHVHLGQVTEQSAGYISEYVLKKMTGRGDDRLRGRNPEFARMSLRPGIGRDFVSEMASAWIGLGRDGDVPPALRIGDRVHPVGRYLHNKWRVEVGRGEGCPPEELNEYQSRLLALRESARNSEIAPSFKKALMDLMENDVVAIEQRQELYRRRKVL